MKFDEVTFVSGGVECAAWHVTGEGDALATDAGRPVVVMAHGLAGTKDSGLQSFAEALAGAGLDVFAFDYRGFGASEGMPRQTVSMAGQLEDYQAAMAAAARLPGVDPKRLVLWGVSLAGGHVFAAAAGRDDIAAVVALTPLVDGMAAGRHALAFHKKSAMLRSTVAGFRSKVGQPVMMPVVARPGELGALTLEGCLEDYLAIAGPTWVNEIDATVGLELGNHRPARVRPTYARPCWCRSPTSTAARPRRPLPRPPLPPAPRCATIPATTSMSTTARSGTTRWWRIRWRSWGGCSGLHESPVHRGFGRWSAFATPDKRPNSLRSPVRRQFAPAY